MSQVVRLLVLFLVLASASTSFAQKNDVLRNLMPYPKVAYMNNDTLFEAKDYIRLYGHFRGLDPEIHRVFSKSLFRVIDLLKTRANITLNDAWQDHNQFAHNYHGIVFGIKGHSYEFDANTAYRLKDDEVLDIPESYMVDITPTTVFVAGADTSGLMHGITRLAELWQNGPKLPSVHIVDHPDYPNRWVFSMHNLRGTNAVNVLKNIADTMQRYMYNGLQQNDFKYNLLEEQPDWYFRNADTIKQYTDDRQIEIIPGVAPMGYSEGLLWHDPNLAEGFPASALYVIEGDTGRLIADPPVNIVNGGFENTNGANFTGFGFYDNENNATQPDKAIFRSGSQSARTIDPKKANPAGNARFSLPVDTKPNKHYYLSAWVRTEAIDRGEIRLLAIGTDGQVSRVLTHTAFNVASTTDRTKNNGWVKLGTLFNTQEFSKMNIYCGIWSGNTGTIWWDDFKIEEAGLVNILRRGGTPLTLVEEGSSTSFEEGVDSAPLHDQIMESTKAYTYHAAPTLRRLANGKLQNGDTVRVGYYHAYTTIHDVNGIGQNMICPSEERTYELLRDQFTRVDSLHNGPHKYMIGHDEIRHLNWDHACTSRELTAAQLLSSNVHRVTTDLKQITGTNDIYVWSDMFDTLHNAVNDYYAVNGDLHGIANLIPKDLTIINWNFGKKRQSMEYFRSRQFSQMTAPYYDARNTTNMREWRLAMEGISKMRGMMYTTWSADYSHLRPFSYYAWGAGPYIIHRPIDSAKFAGGALIEATVLPDPFDPNDSIVSVQISAAGQTNTTFTAGPNNTFTYVLQYPIEWYRIKATNKQGLSRTTPTYRAYPTTGSVSDADNETDLLIYPNPTASSLSVRSGVITRVLSISGAEAMHFKAPASTVDVTMLSAGSYLVEVETAQGLHTVKFVKQ